MRRAVAILACCFFVHCRPRADEPLSPDGTPLFIRGEASSLGARKSEIHIPGRRRGSAKGEADHRHPGESCCHAVYHAARLVTLPPAPRFLRTARLSFAWILPDRNGILYVEERTGPHGGTSRLLQSPPLAPGTMYPLRIGPRSASVIVC